MDPWLSSFGGAPGSFSGEMRFFYNSLDPWLSSLGGAPDSFLRVVRQFLQFNGSVIEFSNSGAPDSFSRSLSFFLQFNGSSSIDSIECQTREILYHSLKQEAPAYTGRCRQE